MIREARNTGMFGTGKKIDQLQQSLQQWISSEERKKKEWEQNEKERQQCFQERQQSERDGFERISGQMEKLTDAAGKQEMAVADMLDTWEEWQDRLEAQSGSLQAKLLEKTEKELAEKAEQEKALLESVVSAWDQLFNLRLAARQGADAAWIRQLDLAESMLREKAIHAGLQQTGCVGEPFSYGIHEAVERVDTDRAEADMTVAGVLSPGYWYRGQALRKSRVAVYRLK